MQQENEIQQNSLQEELNGIGAQPNQLIEQEIQQIDYGKKTDHIHQMISRLNQEEQILKQTLKFKQKQLLDTFRLLYQKKQYLQSLVINQLNQKQLQLDIGLYQQFQQLKTIITNQKKQIDQLKDQIAKQGLSGKNNDQDFIRVFTKISQMQKQIQIGKKFASTQFVRDYFDKPQVYKVAYEQVKYQFQIRAKIKQSLQLEKQHYNAKKEQVAKAILKQKEIQQQLLKQKDNLLKQLKSLS